jgi:hypothetical protein
MPCKASILRRNYFVFPYVEVDGKEFSNVATKNSFADVSPGTAVARR